MRVDEFRYDLPDSAVAQQPAEPRHAARLLDTRSMSDHTFGDLPNLLREGDLVVINNTRVRKARLRGRKAETGARVELLILDRTANGSWKAMIRPSRRIRPGTVVEFDGFGATIVDGPDDGIVTVVLDASDAEEAFEEVGEVPLPPYFTGHLPDPGRYQTMFARAVGSAAAPTAGLHFTPEVVAGLGRRKIEIAEVELHVGMDTFRPMSTDTIEEHVMHSEWCSVPKATADAVARTRRVGARVVAVGTTTARTLETFAGSGGNVRDGQTDTNLFLSPGSAFQVVDLMVTNFHVPGSTLVVMIAAFMGDLWRVAYQEAMERSYRFLSFGDAMLCEREEG